MPYIPNETTVADYDHWNEEAAIVQAAERSIYDGEPDPDPYEDDYY